MDKKNVIYGRTKKGWFRMNDKTGTIIPIKNINKIKIEGD